MSENAGIKEQLRKEFGESIFIGEEIDRTCLADIVFRDSAKLGILNNIVHGAVKEHFKAWCEQKPVPLVFIETAILYESGLNELVDAEWRVYAPVDIRVERVVKRNSISEEKVLDRIKAQIYKPGEYDLKPPVTELCNDGRKAVMPQLIEALMRCFQN